MTTLPLHLEDDTWWVGEVRLSSWAGFQSRRGAYGALDTASPSDGLVRLVFAPEGRGPEPLSQEEQLLVRWVLDHEAELSTEVQHAILNACRAPRRTRMPGVATIDGLRKLIGLHSVHVHQVQHGGLPYVGFELGCDWDAEHGLGVLMHGTRPVEVGAADTAILLWLARADAERLAHRDLQ